MKSTQGAGGRDPLEDSEKRESFFELRERYAEARKLVSPDESCANLEWIVGARRNTSQDPPGLETKTIELAALWLQDLAVEVDRGALSSHRAGQSAAQGLRDATARFLLAFRTSPADPTEGLASRCYDSGPLR